MLAVDWVALSSIVTAAATLVLAVATFASERLTNRATLTGGFHRAFGIGHTRPRRGGRLVAAQMGVRVGEKAELRALLVEFSRKSMFYNARRRLCD